MKVSIITAVYNNRETVEDCLRSVLGQTYPKIEYLVIDGGSTDGTLRVIETYRSKIDRWVSERDGGIYSALNKGLNLATGEVVGILHSDDIYAHDRVVERVVAAFEKSGADSVYGDLKYVDKNDPKRVIRSWKSSTFIPGKFRFGWMPPHPTFFVKKKIFENYGGFNETLRIAADYELMLRFLEKHRISTYYLPEFLIHMRIGGISNRGFRNILLKSREDLLAWKLNDLNSGFYTIPMKNLLKIPQFFMKKGQGQS
jgi:glycosyltransferase involved in cell wall biosynthesis